MERLIQPSWCGAMLPVVWMTLVLAGGAEVLAQEPGTVVAADRRVQARSYVFPETGKTIPYALFVPANYDSSKKWPLIVGLHGNGRPYDWLMGYNGIIDFAQAGGYIMVTPLGYHPGGAYGSRGPGIPEDYRCSPEKHRKSYPLIWAS